MVCAQGIARAHLKYSDVGWRGKGQNKCYGITMDSVCSLTLYTLYRGVVVPPLKPLLLPTSPSPESPPPSHPSSTHLLPPPPPPPPHRSLSSNVIASFSPFWSLYWQQPVALLMCACMRERRSRVYKRPRCKREFVWMCTHRQQHSQAISERRKKEKKRKEETETAKREWRRRRKERRKKIREKVTDSIGGNEFKMAARDSVSG